MSTFKELQQQLLAAKSKAKIYQHLVDYIESSFRPQAGASAKKVMLTDDKIPIADSYFEQVVKELFSGLENVTTQITQIEGMPLQAPVSIAVPANVAPVQIAAPAPVPAPAPVVAPKTKSTTQGEAKS